MAASKPSQDEKQDIPVIATIGARKFRINAVDLKWRERMDVGDHMGMPYLQVLASEWNISEKFISYLGWLAVSRRTSDYDYGDFLDLLDAEKATVKLYADGLPDEDGEGKKSDRPTKKSTSKKTSGGRSTPKSA